MTFGAWFIVGIVFVMVAIFTCSVCAEVTSISGRILAVLVAVLIIAAITGGFLWYYNNTAAGQRAMIDQQASLGRGLERTITIYTANGEIIATYTGMIDIETNDGGYVKFDFEGKRYIYYNCFVETIADIE